MYLLHYCRSSEDQVENRQDERELSKYPMPVHLCVEYILNGQGTTGSKEYENQKNENGCQVLKKRKGL
jgi:hypothetical protein